MPTARLWWFLTSFLIFVGGGETQGLCLEEIHTSRGDLGLRANNSWTRLGIGTGGNSFLPSFAAVGVPLEIGSSGVTS